MGQLLLQQARNALNEPVGGRRRGAERSAFEAPSELRSLVCALGRFSDRQILNREHCVRSTIDDRQLQLDPRMILRETMLHLEAFSLARNQIDFHVTALLGGATCAHHAQSQPDRRGGRKIDLADKLPPFCRSYGIYGTPVGRLADGLRSQSPSISPGFREAGTACGILVEELRRGLLTGGKGRLLRVTTREC
jgi:hypothetical protein